MRIDTAKSEFYASIARNLGGGASLSVIDGSGSAVLTIGAAGNRPRSAKISDVWTDGAPEAELLWTTYADLGRRHGWEYVRAGAVRTQMAEEALAALLFLKHTGGSGTNRVSLEIDRRIASTLLGKQAGNARANALAQAVKVFSDYGIAFNAADPNRLADLTGNLVRESVKRADEAIRMSGCDIDRAMDELRVPLRGVMAYRTSDDVFHTAVDRDPAQAAEVIKDLVATGQVDVEPRHVLALSRAQAAHMRSLGSTPPREFIFLGPEAGDAVRVDPANGEMRAYIGGRIAWETGPKGERFHLVPQAEKTPVVDFVVAAASAHSVKAMERAF
jgi:hypothetical protein